MQHGESHSSDGAGKALPLTGDVGHLKLQLSCGKPGVGRLRPKLAQLDFDYPLLLLLAISNRLVYNTNCCQHL